MQYKKEQIEAEFQYDFEALNPGQKIPSYWMSWMYDAYLRGYNHGESDAHDWY